MIHHVMVIGYGIMGSGIARSFARGGHQVTVISRDPSRITNLPEGIFAVSELPHDPPDLIIEAIPEDIGLKNSLFAKLEEAYNGAAILATNTSGLSMETMSSELHYPDHFIGIHYFHPAELFPTVEVILTQQTAPETLGSVETALNRNGQQAVVLNRSIPGFLVNRLQHAMLHEAFSMIDKGIATAEDIDRVCKTMFGPRMCVTGLLEQKDISGLNTTASVQRTLVPLLDHSGTPVDLLQDMVAQGQIGVKSGRGFYDWHDRDVETYKKISMDKLSRILSIVAEN